MSSVSKGVLCKNHKKNCCALDNKYCHPENAFGLICYERRYVIDVVSSFFDSLKHQNK